jgi:peptide/nickel transport system permease protein
MAVESVPGSIAEASREGVGFNARALGGTILRFLSGPYIPVFVLLVVMVLPAIFASVLAPHDPLEVNPVNRLQPPVFAGGSWDYPLGTDTLGRDILSRMMHGARISFFISLSALSVALMIGATTGLVAGYFGAWVDHVLMRLVDIKIALPDILVALVLVSVVGPSVLIALVIVVFFIWSTFARVTRAQVLVLRELDFVALAKIAGAGRAWIIRKHILPNVMNTLMVVASLTIGVVILLEATLSFLGVGIPRPTPAWGVMVADGRDHLARAWWISTFPGLAIVMVVLAFNFLGDWLRDRLDPKRRNLI